MRIKLLFCLIITAIHFTGFSQESYYALRGGYNISTLNSSNNSGPDLNNRNTFSLGIVYCNEPNNVRGKIGYSVELGYTRKGARIEQDTLDYKFHYIHAPIQIDVYPIKQIKISAGPEFSFLASAKNHINDTTKVSILNTYNKRFEVAGVVSASASLSFFLDLGVKYSYSFTKVSKYDGILNRQNLYNSYIQVFLLMKIAN